MVLVTGPTGSGKTTTLYAALAALNSPEFKLMTVEDPVEYQLPGIQQVRYSQAKGAPDNWIYVLNFWTRTFNRTSAPVAGIRSDCTRTTIPCNALHSTSAKNSGFCRSGPSAMTNSAKAARRAVGVSSLANLIFVGKTNIAS